MAVITGSSGGIGSELCKTFLKHGYIVVGIDRNDSCNRYSAEDAKRYFYLKMDLAEFVETKKTTDFVSEIKELVPEKVTSFILINNAASQTLYNIADVNADACTSDFNVNAIAPVVLVCSLLSILSSCNGHIINICSVHSKLTKKNFFIYAATKSALDSLTKSLAIDLAEYNVVVNGVSPAAIETPMLLAGFDGDDGALETLRTHHPVKNIGSARSLAKLIYNCA